MGGDLGAVLESLPGVVGQQTTGATQRCLQPLPGMPRRVAGSSVAA
jgi:hypothetical protein